MSYFSSFEKVRVRLVRRRRSVLWTNQDATNHIGGARMGHQWLILEDKNKEGGNPTVHTEPTVR